MKYRFQHANWLEDADLSRSGERVRLGQSQSLCLPGLL